MEGGVGKETHMGDADLTLRQALAGHRLESGFGPDGDLEDKWISYRLGPIPMCFPNWNGRRRATAIHDLNHVLTGYGHDTIGEAEISAFELASGCKGYLAAWTLGGAALGMGMFHSPCRVFGAFVRGRYAKNLYGADIETALDTPVTILRSNLGMDVGARRPTALDRLLFSLTLVVAPLLGAIPGFFSIISSPLWIFEGGYRQRPKQGLEG